MSTSIEPRRRNALFSQMRPGARTHTRATLLRLVVVLLGVAAGIAAAIYTHGRDPDGWLTFFVFAMVTYTFGWGLAQVITRLYRVQRALYFALEPVLSTSVLYAALRFGTPMWLAVILGFVAGGMLHTVLGWALLPQVTAEEEGANRWYQRSAGSAVGGEEDWPRDQVRGFFRHPIRAMIVGMAVDHYYTAIKARDYTTAYDSLGGEARAAISREAFITQAEARDVTDGAVEEFAEVGMDPDDAGSVTLAVARPAGTDTVHLHLRREDDTWRVTAFDAI